MDKLKLSDFLEKITEPNRSKCKLILIENRDRFELSPGSLSKHQAWPGGYIAHLEETMNFGTFLFEHYNKIRPFDFSLSDVILVLFLHDLEKPFRYVDPKTHFENEEEKKAFVNNLIKKYKITLEERHLNALKYIHGEGDDFSRTSRVQQPLSAFVHLCDVASARIWYDYPKV